MNGTSLDAFVRHWCPYPTVGRPTGSGLGVATKPSKGLMRLSVAWLTCGGLQAVAPRTQIRRSAREGLKSILAGLKWVFGLNGVQETVRVCGNWAGSFWGGKQDKCSMLLSKFTESGLVIGIREILLSRNRGILYHSASTFECDITCAGLSVRRSACC